MPYVVTAGCVDIMDKSCILECPVDCIYEGDRMMYIQPDECIDCGACELVCPQDAVLYAEDGPETSLFLAATDQVFSAVGSPRSAKKHGPLGFDPPSIRELEPKDK
nr:ferredoxin [Rhodococcus wratislaviensis]GLK33651.1 putative ferredoxin FdxC [Rhodococcus wratislaviensis]